jgi:UDP-N-acetylenolpyruvoylglucosamine reductase
MPVPAETIERLGSIPNLAISRAALLSRYTRFGIGGPADVYIETADETTFMQAFSLARSSGADYTVIGDGTNLIVSDDGFPGIATAPPPGRTPALSCRPWWIIASTSGSKASRP